MPSQLLEETKGITQQHLDFSHARERRSSRLMHARRSFGWKAQLRSRRGQPSFPAEAYQGSCRSDELVDADFKLGDGVHDVGWAYQLPDRSAGYSETTFSQASKHATCPLQLNILKPPVDRLYRRGPFRWHTLGALPCLAGCIVTSLSADWMTRWHWTSMLITKIPIPL